MLDRLALLFVRTLIFLLDCLPEKAAIVLAHTFIKFVFLLMPRYRQVAAINIQFAFPNKSPAECLSIFKESKRTLAKHLVYFARITHLTTESVNRMVDYKDAASLCRSVAAKNPDVGILFVTMHFGPFELLVQAHCFSFRPVSYLARSFGLPKLDAWWNARRELFGNKVFGREGGYREIIKRLTEKRDVGLLCDQNVTRNHAVFVDFFGTKAATTKTVALASIRAKAPVILLSAIETAPGRYRVDAEELGKAEEEQGSSNEKVERFTQRLNKSLEEIIRAQPTQWFWIHRRWKTRPEGEEENFYTEKLRAQGENT